MTDIIPGVSIGPDGLPPSDFLASGFSQMQAAINSSLQLMLGTQAIGDTAFGQEQSATQAGAQADIAKTNIDAAAKVKVQADDANSAAITGGDTRIATSVINMMANKMNGLTDNMYDLGQTIAEKQKATLLNDPMQFLTNIITLPADIARYNTMESNRDQLQAATSGIIQKTEYANTENALLDQKNALEEAKAINMKTMADAAKNIAETSEKQAMFDQGITSAKAALNNDQFTHVIQLNGAYAQRATVLLDEARESYYDAATQRMKMEMPLMEAQKNLTIQALKDKQDDIDITTANLARLKPYGINLTYTQFMHELAPAQREALFNLMGSMATNNTPSVSPFTSVAMGQLRDAGIQLPPTIAQIQGMLESKLTSIMEQNSVGPGAPKLGTVAAYYAAIPRMEQDIKDQRTNTPYRDSIFSLPPTQGILTRAPFLATTPLGKDLTALAKSDPNYVPSTDLIAQRALALVQKGADINMVADNVAKYFSAGRDMNNDIHNYPLLAINPMTGYNATADFGAMAGRTGKPIDWTDPSQVKNALTRAVLQGYAGNGRVEPISSGSGTAVQWGPDYKGLPQSTEVKSGVKSMIQNRPDKIQP